jgi:hypothetical protein
LTAHLSTLSPDNLFDVALGFSAVPLSVAFQAFFVTALRAMQKKGGNALGYLQRQCSDDTATMKGVRAFLDNVRKIAKHIGFDNNYIYMPYASRY